MNNKSYLIIACASIVILLSMGVRQSFGLFQTPIAQTFEIGLAAFSLSLAIQNLLWGLSQPFIGALADKFGSGRIIALSAVAQVIGLLVLANATSIWELHLGVGVIIGIAGSGTTWAVMLAVVARNVPEKRRSFFFGVTSAMGTGGQIIIAPINQISINTFGWVDTIFMLSILLITIVPLAYVLRGKAANSSVRQEAADTLSAALNKARKHSGYLFLTAGFFVCGFHVMFIMAHLPTYLTTELQLSAWLPGTAISVIGATNLIGTVFFGWLGDKYSKKYLLSTIYFLRSVTMAGFIAFPASEISVLVFCFFIGFLWLSTVPLTNGLVGQIFGIKYLATLGGIVFASHQVGSFVSVWIGGWLFDLTQSYMVIWQVAIVLGIIAAVLHLPIKDKPVSETATQAA